MGCSRDSLLMSFEYCLLVPLILKIRCMGLVLEFLLVLSRGFHDIDSTVGEPVLSVRNPLHEYDSGVENLPSWLHLGRIALHSGSTVHQTDHLSHRSDTLCGLASLTPKTCCENLSADSLYVISFEHWLSR